MHKLLAHLQAAYPQFTFEPNDYFRWQASTATVSYKLSKSISDTMSLLHEVGHGILGHTAFGTDADLLQKEVAAWQEARRLARQLQISFDEMYMEDCLDTYRDWQFMRSQCPGCKLQGVQRTSTSFLCLNCNHCWRVSQARFCRPYRVAEKNKES